MTPWECATCLPCTCDGTVGLAQAALAGLPACLLKHHASLHSAQAAMGADLTLVSAAIANNISAAVRLAAIDIGGLSAQGTNGVILGGPDALAAAAIICGLDISE